MKRYPRWWCYHTRADTHQLAGKVDDWLYCGRCGSLKRLEAGARRIHPTEQGRFTFLIRELEATGC